jgi:hypothetical protein
MKALWIVFTLSSVALAAPPIRIPKVDINLTNLEKIEACLRQRVQEGFAEAHISGMTVTSVRYPEASPFSEPDGGIVFPTTVKEPNGAYRPYFLELRTAAEGIRWKFYHIPYFPPLHAPEQWGYKTPAMSSGARLMEGDNSGAVKFAVDVRRCWGYREP